jgi:hypothetical protein
MQLFMEMCCATKNGGNHSNCPRAHTIPTGETRWNSLYDSFKQIIALKEKSAELCKALHLKRPLSNRDFEYLQEHVQCTESIAILIDMLQGEDNIFYGILLPSLVALDRKLQILCEREWTYCKPLVTALRNSVRTRFTEFFKFTTSLSMDALSYPRFKSRWLTLVNTEHRDMLLTAFTNTIRDHHFPEESYDEFHVSTPVAVPDNFFDFGLVETLASSSRSKVDSEVRAYFEDQTRDIRSLERYPLIKSVFFKYNTPLPSSAPVERLFSFATMANTPKGNRISDDHFEERVILKANMTSLNSFSCI